MIGVVAHSSQLPWAYEFFELFKTPWELIVPGRYYEAVLIVDSRTLPVNARVALVYGTHANVVDNELGVKAEMTTDRFAHTAVASIPVAAGLSRFSTGAGPATPITEHAYTADWRGTKIIRIGYDLFAEVANLLSNGQPVEHAEIPTLELHISLIRHCLQSEQVAFVEIPPRPFGHDFTCCLTHDIDFFGIRRHLVDRTLMGFLLRATAGTALEVLRGRRAGAHLRRNLAAACSLPLIFAGVKRDFWQPFEDYALADRGYPRTFFVVPTKGHAGLDPENKVQASRAVSYEARDIAGEIQAASEPNTEFAVHGIDAWRDWTSGRRELASIAEVAGGQRHGVRMHWLYYDEESPRALEGAGFQYDSTWGYNDAIGYRAGTMQPFKLHGTTDLLELPLAIMDTAMLYPGRMALSPAEANAKASKVVCDARSYGGALVVNWHDRSLAPERQWNESYSFLLDQLESAKPWFATMTSAADWFRWRRAIRFNDGGDSGNVVTISAPSISSEWPPARIAVREATIGKTLKYSGGVEQVRL